MPPEIVAVPALVVVSAIATVLPMRGHGAARGPAVGADRSDAAPRSAAGGGRG